MPALIGLGSAFASKLGGFFSKRKIKAFTTDVSTKKAVPINIGTGSTKKPKLGSPTGTGNMIWILLAVGTGLLFMFPGDKKKVRRRTMSKVRAARRPTKKKAGSRSGPRKKKTKAQLKAIRIRNLAKARRARRK